MGNRVHVCVCVCLVTIPIFCGHYWWLTGWVFGWWLTPHYLSSMCGSNWWSFHLFSDFMPLSIIYYSDQTRGNDVRRFITLFFSLVLNIKVLFNIWLDVSCFLFLHVLLIAHTCPQSFPQNFLGFTTEQTKAHLHQWKYLCTQMCDLEDYNARHHLQAH